jgi:hypothetical protein
MSIASWAAESFGRAQLGDERRTRRLVAMAEATARRPAGRVTEVFSRPAERQAAYDLLEHDCVPQQQVAGALFDATARSAKDQDRVFVAVDGSSLTLTDRTKAKGFGHIGPSSYATRGLKVMSALAIRSDGVPLGLVDQVWWARHHRVKSRTAYRPADQRESMHWRNVVATVGERGKELAPGTRLHFLFDREGDASLLLRSVIAAGHEFTCRSKANRKVLVNGRRCDLRRVLLRQPVIATRQLELPSTSKRRARVATLDIRAAQLPMVLRDTHHRQRRVVMLTVVWARERGRSPRCGGLDWFLYQNVPVRSADDARAAVARYALRWRIEDFHRAWKRGLCHVEDTQLRSPTAVIKWATLLAAVATRAEKLRLRARAAPDEPASTELSEDEILALVTLRSESRPRESVSADGLTVGVAVRWIADLGGYVGNKTSGPPGTVTIGRGLEPLVVAAAVIANLRSRGKLR